MPSTASGPSRTVEGEHTCPSEGRTTADTGLPAGVVTFKSAWQEVAPNDPSNATYITVQTTVPRIHCVITGIEKVIPTLEDFATLIRLLPRSAVGQSIANYLTLTTVPRLPDETEGP